MLRIKTARIFRDKPAIIHGDKQLSYAQFDARVNRLANALQRLGLKQGEKVAILQYSTACVGTPDTGVLENGRKLGRRVAELVKRLA